MIDPFMLDWLNLGIRWLHVIAGIAWIGSSFYFMALDASLRARPGQPEGVLGEAWQVHGGGFYHMQKYGVAPAQMPQELTWFKWEAYFTFFSGFALLAVMYYASANLYMIDPAKADIGHWTAAGIGIAVLLGGIVIYEICCRAPFGQDQRVLAVIGLIAFPLTTLLLNQVLTERGAFMHTGALIGTIMVANVAHIIIPNQRKVVKSLLAGEKPDPRLGKQAKQRSVHNNYLTLPVVLVMISFHYPQIFANQLNWLIYAFVLIAGAAIRHFFNEHHAGRKVWWAWGVAALAAIAVIWLGQRPLTAKASVAEFDTAEIEYTILGRCQMCHANEPYWDGIAHAPKGVVFETMSDIERHAHSIYTQAAMTHAMPPGNVSGITGEERQLIATWYLNR